MTLAGIVKHNDLKFFTYSIEFWWLQQLWPWSYVKGVTKLFVYSDRFLLKVTEPSTKEITILLSRYS